MPRGTPEIGSKVTLGERLRRVRKAAKLEQEEVARAAGVHVKTVSRWENDRQVPDDTQLDLVAELLGTSTKLLKYGPEEVPQRPAADRVPAVPQGLPKSVRVYMQQFLLELAEADVSDREIEEARRSLTSPENYTFYVGGNPVEYSEEDALMGVRSFALAIRGILRDRGYKKLKAK